MIGKLKGLIDEISDDSFIIDVGGVGYLVFASKNTLSKIAEGEVSTIFIETYVREELISLFGFISKIEKETFKKLNLVSGVGTRMALAILSSFSPSEIAQALQNADKELFKSISGIGSKLAERIILELKDKIISTSSTIVNVNNDIISDAVSALINLGINRNDAHLNIRKILKTNPNISLDELIRVSLKSRNN